MTKNEIDKKLFLLDYETKEQLLELLEASKKLDVTEISEPDFEVLDILKQSAFEEWMQLNIDEPEPEYRQSMRDIKKNLQYLAAKCLQIINKLD